MTVLQMLMVVLLYSLPTFAVSLSSAPHAQSTNNPFLGSVIPAYPANLTAPLPPPGFSIRLDFNTSARLSPVEVYFCTMEIVSVLANMVWTDCIQVPMLMSGYASMEIEVRPIPTGSGSRLQIGHAVLGLYKAGVEIAQGNMFFELVASLYIGDEKIGRFEVRPRKGWGPDSQLLDLGSGYANDTTTVMADSGTILDPLDRDFSIKFSWDGVRIKSQDIFTAILDGLAIAAEHANTDINAYISAARSAGGGTVLSTWISGEEGNVDMTWGRLKRALLMVWDLLVIGPKGKSTRFEGLMFGLRYRAKDIGAGRILRFDTSTENVEGSAVQK